VSYLLAVSWIRLDIAAVLGSTYPVITVLLFRAVLHEPVRRPQRVGIAVWVVANGMIAW
jgi:drug/metabolite transporter (DMT)-like permease